MPRTRRPRAAQSWYTVNAVSAERAELWIYDEIGFWGVSAADFATDLRGINAPAIDLHVNSPGGEVYDAIAIYNVLRSHKADVTVHIDGLAASAASFISMAGDKVVIARNAEMMIHDAIGIAWDNAAGMRLLADQLDRVSDNIADIYAQRAGGTAAEWRERMQVNNGDGTWYSGAEAVAAGLADEIASATPSPDGVPSNRWTRSSVAASRARALERVAPTQPEPTDDAAWDDLLAKLLDTHDGLVTTIDPLTALREGMTR